MIDPLTKTEFTPRRSNQKFESARNRNTFHNHASTEIRKKKAFVDKHLRINFRILHDLLPQNKELKEKTFHKQFMLGKGYNFSVHTHLEIEAGKNHYAIYNYTIILLENEMIKIIFK
jgi:hypothetical protein